MSLRIIIFHIFITPLASGQDIVLISKGFQRQELTQHFSYFKTNTITSPDSALRFFADHPDKITRQTEAFIGIVRKPYWFLVNLKNQSEQEDFILEIQHSHLRHIELYEVKEDEVVYINTVGVIYPFGHRPIPHRHFAFPLKITNGSSTSLLIYVNHENSLALPTTLWAAAAFHQSDYDFNMMAGIGFGFLLFCTFFSLIAFVLLRNSIFGWYSLYLIFTAIYSFQDLGYAFQYVFPSAAQFDGPFSIYSPLLQFIALVKFIQSFLSIKKNFPRINISFNSLIAFLLLLIVIDLVFQESLRQFSFYLLPAVFVLVSFGLVMLLAVGILSLKKNRKTAQLFLASYTVLMLSLLVAIFGNAFGIASYSVISIANVGVLVEVSIFSFALMLQYRDIQLDRLLLQEKLSLQQKEMYKNYIEGIEKERNRIAGDLHDDIGSKLSHLKRSLFHDGENDQSKLMDEIINDVRTISHDLAPTVAQVSGLMPLVEKLVANTRKESGIDVKLQVFDFKEVLRPDQIIQLYRILQEALNNIIKHSDATKADIQLFGHENEIHLTIEDNGKGFDTSNILEGLGLNQMKIRTESLGGRIEINSHEGLGTFLLVQIPN